MKASKGLVCVMLLLFALMVPATAFAATTAVGSGGWFDGEGVSGTDLDGKDFEIHAGVIEAGLPYQIELTDKAPSNWPANANNALDAFITVSGDPDAVRGTVWVMVQFDESYDGLPIVFYIENADGTTEAVQATVGNTQYLVSGVFEGSDEFQGFATIGVAFGGPVSFSDVDSSTYHTEDIAWLASSGITTGFPDGTFRPMAEVARCDMAAFLYRLAGSPAYEVTEEDMAKFSDVDEGTPHLKEVCWLASEGISTGFPDGTFRPLASIARCDMAAFLQRLGDLMSVPEPGAGASFSDVDGSTPHAESIAWLSGAGITTGFPDGTFRPLDTIVRCDMAAFLHRLDGLIPA